MYAYVHVTLVITMYDRLKGAGEGRLYQGFQTPNNNKKKYELWM